MSSIEDVLDALTGARRVEKVATFGEANGEGKPWLEVGIARTVRVDDKAQAHVVSSSGQITSGDGRGGRAVQLLLDASAAADLADVFDELSARLREEKR